MFNFLICVGAIGFISWQLAIFFNDVWLRDAQQKRLRQRFEDWWLTVEDLDKLKLALACTIKLNEIIDKVFGVRIISKRAFSRTLIAASGLLLASLGLVGLQNHQIFGIAPWANYRQTAEYVQKAIPQLQENYRSLGNARMPVTNIVRQSSSALVTTTNVTYITNTAALDVALGLETVKQTTIKYNTTAFVTFYSLLFLVILFVLNGLLCFCCLIISRLILREMIAAARPFSTFALLATNLFLVVNVSSVFLLCLTVLYTPIVWFFLPVVFIFISHSFSLFILVFFSGQIATWVFTSPALRVVTVIAMLPFIFTFCISIFSYAAMICRNAFHKCVSAVLLRCAEKGPLTVIVVTTTLTVSIIGGLINLIHWIR